MNDSPPPRRPGRRMTERQRELLERLQKEGPLDLVATVDAWWGCDMESLSREEASLLVDDAIAAQRLARKHPNKFGIRRQPEPDDGRTAEYREYMQSDAWAERRQQFLMAANWRCERCAKRGSLDVHHRHYDTLGAERRCDVQVLCRPCHQRADRSRKAQARRERWHARVEGWAEKVYGEDWEATVGWEEAEQAFDEWLERR